MKQKQTSISQLDILILLKIISLWGKDWYQSDLAKSLGISQSEVSKSLHRLKIAWLLTPNNKYSFVMRDNVLEFLKYGIRYVYPQWPGAIVRGIPTAHSSPVMKNEIASNDHFVWPYAKGTIKGQSIIPLYHTVPEAALTDNNLYQLLALVDAIRIGNARDKQLSFEKLEKRILLGEYNN